MKTAKDFAFARVPSLDPQTPGSPGLTKREYFSIMALQGILASAQGGNTDVKCEVAVEYADELLEVLALAEGDL